MKSLCSLFVLVLLAHCCWADDGPFKLEKPVLTDIEPCGTIQIEKTEQREWKDPVGHAIEAKLVGLAAGLVYLQRGDETPSFPLAALSANDRAYIRSVFRAADREEMFPGVSDPKDEAAKLTLTERQWQSKIDSWTGIVHAKKLRLSDKVAARNHLRNIRDPAALGVLISTLAKNPLDRPFVFTPGFANVRPRLSFDLNDAIQRSATIRVVGRMTNDAARTAYIEAIAAINGKNSVETLVKTVVSDKSGGVRAAAAWAICNLKDTAPALAEYAKYLKKKESRDSALIGVLASGYLDAPKKNEMTYEINKTLIDLLIVDQPIDVPFVKWYYEGGMNWGHFHGGGYIQRFWVPVPCEIAHDMLYRQSGYDYGYDPRNWTEWNKEKNYPTSQVARQPDSKK